MLNFKASSILLHVGVDGTLYLDENSFQSASRPSKLSCGFLFRRRLGPSWSPSPVALPSANMSQTNCCHSTTSRTLYSSAPGCAPWSLAFTLLLTRTRIVVPFPHTCFMRCHTHKSATYACAVHETRCDSGKLTFNTRLLSVPTQGVSIDRNTTRRYATQAHAYIRMSQSRLDTPNLAMTHLRKPAHARPASRGRPSIGNIQAGRLVRLRKGRAKGRR